MKIFKNRVEFCQWLPSNAICCEMGVERGHHALQILKHAKPKELHLIDFWTQSTSFFPDHAEKILRHKQEAEQSLAPYPNVTIYDDNVTQVLPTFPDHYFDWIYIDTFHGYDDIKRDIELALPKIKPQGIICGHDLAITYDDHLHLHILAAITDLLLNTDKGNLVAINELRQPDWAVQLR